MSPTVSARDIQSMSPLKPHQSNTVQHLKSAIYLKSISGTNCGLPSDECEEGDEYVNFFKHILEANRIYCNDNLF